MITLRFDLGGITAAAPRSSRTARSQSASNALSPSKASKLTPSMSGATPTLSWRCPGSRMKRTRLQGLDQGDDFARQTASRTSDGVLLSAPFGTARLLMDGDDRAIDHRGFEIRFSGQGLEDALKNHRPHPAAEAREHAVPMAELGRQVPPGQSCPGTPQHGFEKQPVVLRRHATIRFLARQQSLDLRPNGVAENESSRIHKPSLR